jgi:sugar lactone lactonase YvrE
MPFMHSRRRLIRITAAIAIICVVGVAVWLWHLSAEQPTLETGWTAVVAVIAGDGVAGIRDGHVTRARFDDPFGVASASDGSIYVADAGDAQRIRRISPDGMVSTIAGGQRGFLDERGSAARFNTPSGLALDATGAVLVADTGNNAIRRITPDGIVSTLGGDGSAGYVDGIGSETRFNGPIGVAVDATGRVIIADTYNDRIRAILPDGRVITVAGSGQPGFVDGPAAEAQFHTPCGVAIDAAGNIYVADTGNSTVRMVSADGFVSTLYPVPDDGLVRPVGIAVSGAMLYVTDDRGRVVEITPALDARVLAGSRPGFADGTGPRARFRPLRGLAVSSMGRLIVTDPRNAVIRRVTAPALVERVQPTAPGINPQFDSGSFAREPLLWPLVPMDGPFEITGTLGELRGGEGSERFHAGLDVHAVEGTEVRAVRAGVVDDPIATGEFGSLNESLRVGSVAYVHLRVGRQRKNELIDSTDVSRFIPTYDDSGRMVSMRVKRGTRFDSGDAIGTTNAFNHVHMNVGWPGEEYNPLQFRLVQFEDHIRPTIPTRGIRLFRHDWTPVTARKKGRLVVDGIVHVVVDAWDRVDGNKRRRRLGLYELGYQVLNRDGSPASGFELPRQTIRFNRLDSSDEAARVVYASGSGIPFYGRRSTHFLYVVTSSFRDGLVTEDGWDTSTLPPGDYTLRIVAGDIQGNQAAANRDVLITIQPIDSQ